MSKIAKKSARYFAAVARMLAAKYNIRTAEKGERRRRVEALGPEVITLPRIAACFAELTTNLYHREFGRAIINLSEFVIDGMEPPKAMFSPMFSSVVRKGYMVGQTMINIHSQLMLINILVDNVLHVRNRVTPLDQIWTYYLASYNSSVMLPRARIEQCNRFGVTVNGHFSPVITRLREHCLNRIRELRPHERLDDIIREMNTFD